MRTRHVGPDRMSAFSDGVIAVVITIMVLELKPPVSTEPKALAPLWPTAISYVLSYLFIAIIWMNHHHLLRFVRHASPALRWLNFAHLFAVSLLPFATNWMADSRLAATPVSIFAAATVAATLLPWAGFGLICTALLLYLRPEAPSDIRTLNK